METAYDKTPLNSNTFSTQDRVSGSIRMLRLQVAELQENFEELSNSFREIEEMFEEFDPQMPETFKDFKREYADFINTGIKIEKLTCRLQMPPWKTRIGNNRDKSAVTYEGITAMDTAKARVSRCFIYSGFTLLDFAAGFIIINVMWLIFQEIY